MFVKIGKYKKNGKPQNTKVEIHDYDTWSLDVTLAKIIHPALVKFKEDNNHVFYDEENFEEVTSGNPSEERWAAIEARSDEILNEMVWSFEQIANGVELNLDEYLIGEKKEPYFTPVEGHPELSQWNDDTKYDWERYNADNTSFNNRIQKGLDLFAKHYRALWT